MVSWRNLSDVRVKIVGQRSDPGSVHCCGDFADFLTFSCSLITCRMEMIVCILRWSARALLRHFTHACSHSLYLFPFPYHWFPFSPTKSPLSALLPYIFHSPFLLKGIKTFLCVSVCGHPEDGVGSLALELEGVSLLTWVLGTKQWASPGAILTLNGWAMSPAPPPLQLPLFLPLNVFSPFMLLF